MQSDANMIIFIVFITFGLFTNCISIEFSSKFLRYVRQKTPFTLEEALYYYRQTQFDGSWISDNELQFRDSNSGDYIVYDVNTGNFNTFFDYDLLGNITSVSDVSFSEDRKYALIGYNRQQVYRHSAVAQYKILSIQDKWFIDLANSSYLQLSQWAPKGPGIVYVLDNDMYYVTSFDENGETSVRISKTGVPRVVYNGIADWVYEEEILGVSEAFSFSPDGVFLYFTTFNDTNVPEFQYPWYGSPGLDTQYPEFLTVRYPKAGAPNPEYSQHALSTTVKNDIVEEQFPITKAESLDVFLGQKWANNNITYFSYANRVQNETVTWMCLAWSPTNCTEIYKEKVENGWADITLPFVNKKADKFLKIVPWTFAEGRSFPHLKLFNIGGDSAFLTSGQFAVLDVIGWDEDNQNIYFSATEENEPARKQVYSVKEDGTNLYCLSCQLISPEKNHCESASAKFSQKFTYVVLTCAGPDPLISYLYKNSIPLETPISVLEDNFNLRAKLEKKLLPGRLDLRVEVPGPFQAEVRLLLPPNLDTSGQTKYPLIVYVYAGPESKQIDGGFSISYNTAYLTTNLNVIVGMIDGRGSAQKEREMMHATYRNLGNAEIQDQIQVTKYLQNRYPFIDVNRTGIWGWSYGGYSTVKALETDVENVFQCGISVAPVTSWLLYDSLYTERYMGLPTEEDNLSGYMTSNVYNVTNLKKKQYYLIHGSGDDNVHYQQSMLLSKILETNDVLFQQQSYPDENHSLGGVTLHLYHSMVAFWKRCFNLK